ncbi:MAG TPA: serine--tRNA ligase [Solirubrobacteraceae bacterium]|nr:serine--tRNA ligase [Solirubrobacteraceae bacterium]
MLDLKRIRDDPGGVADALARRDPELRAVVEQLLAADEQWRTATTSAEALRAEQKARSQEFGAAKARGEEAPELREQMQALSAEVKRLGEQAAGAKERLDELLARLPNLPDPSAADGPEDEELRRVGEPRQLGFEPKDHLALAGRMIDMDHAANLSGSRFAYLRGELVMVELALVGWVLQKLRGKGFEPVIPPVLVRERALYGTGFLPDTEQQIYSLPEDELFLVGTSEVALASLHDEEIIEGDSLPLRYAGFSPCFRREAGAAGKDTRGIIRVHQFEKVEMFSFVAPEDSAEEHERILSIEEEILRELELPYRVVNIAVNDLGNSAAKKYDCEAWLPAQAQYRELTSCSNTTDYQARRLNIRMRSEGQKGTRAPHTLNGTAVAVGRTLVALLENGQQQDGSVELPAVLAAYGAPAQLAPAAS